MQDMYSILTTLVLFSIAFAYLAGCNRIKAGAKHD